MPEKNLTFLVLGAGAIGGITAAFLKNSGFDVEIVCRDESYASLISQHGIEVSGVRGNIVASMPAWSSVSQVKERKDVILHATKATDMLQIAREAKEILKPGGYVVSMQNGICEEALGKITGHDRIVGCVTGWGATMTGRGKMTMTSTGDFILGYPGRQPDDDLQSIAGALKSVVPVRTTDNIMGHLYSKLIINSCITSLGAICGLYLGEMLSMRKAREIFIAIIKEAVDVAEGMGLKTEVFGGSLDFTRFAAGSSLVDNLRRHLMIRIIGLKYRRLKSSSLQSLERGKPAEVDYLNGFITAKAEEHGIDVPVNRAVVDMIHEIENRIRPISVRNFDDPVFSRII